MPDQAIFPRSPHWPKEQNTAWLWPHGAQELPGKNQSLSGT
ncbi:MULTISPECIES: hypothetical protein [unclassified Synechocystis]|nr:MULTISPECIES: hypothetical protein [unclassified Synechocystis]